GQPLDDVKHLILPAAALAISWIGYFARLIRSNMLEVLTANYVRTARAFGIPSWKIFYKHALQKAAAPTVPGRGVADRSSLGGAIFIEVIFNRPGLGTLAYDAIASRNSPIVQGTALMIAVMVIGANLLADFSYRLLDSRIQLGQTAAA